MQGVTWGGGVLQAGHAKAGAERNMGEEAGEGAAVAGARPASSYFRFQLRNEGPERACDSRQVHRAKQGPVLGVQAQGGMGTKSHKLGISANCPFVVPGPHPSTR